MRVLQVDKDFTAKHPRATCGSTATVAVLRGSVLTVAHVGDSRAVLVRRNSAISITKDHKPDDDAEGARIRVRAPDKCAVSWGAAPRTCLVVCAVHTALTAPALALLRPPALL